METKQDQSDDNGVSVEEGLELLHAFLRIASPELRREVIDLAVALASKEK